MSRRDRRKASGKVVKVRKARRGLRLPKTLAVVLVVAGLIVFTVLTYYTYRPSASESISKELKPYDVLRLLVEGNDSNAILVYSVSGDLLVNNTVLGIHDKLVFLIQPGLINQSTNETSENVVFKYYLIRYDTEHYLSNYLLGRLGTTYLVEDLSNLLVDEIGLSTVCEDFNKTYLGEVSRYVRLLGDVRVDAYEFKCDSTTIMKYDDATYKIPIEVIYVGNNSNVRIVLDDVMKY